MKTPVLGVFKTPVTDVLKSSLTGVFKTPVIGVFGPKLRNTPGGARGFLFLKTPVMDVFKPTNIPRGYDFFK